MEADQGVSQRDRPAAEGVFVKNPVNHRQHGAGIKAGQKLERLCELRLIRYAKPLEYLDPNRRQKVVQRRMVILPVIRIRQPPGVSQP